jgi:hypothetical protein
MLSGRARPEHQVIQNTATHLLLIISHDYQMAAVQYHSCQGLLSHIHSTYHRRLPRAGWSHARPERQAVQNTATHLLTIIRWPPPSNIAPVPEDHLSHIHFSYHKTISVPVIIQIIHFAVASEAGIYKLRLNCATDNTTRLITQHDTNIHYSDHLLSLRCLKATTTSLHSTFFRRRSRFSDCITRESIQDSSSTNIHM